MSFSNHLENHIWRIFCEQKIDMVRLGDAAAAARVRHFEFCVCRMSDGIPVLEYTVYVYSSMGLAHWHWEGHNRASASALTLLSELIDVGMRV